MNKFINIPIWIWITLGGMTISSCHNHSEQANAADYPIHTVTTSNQVVTSAYSATIRGRQDIDIYPQVAGTLVRLCVSEGDNVKQGQLLFVIDQVPYKMALATASANVNTASAALASAQLTFDSQKTLFEQGVVSEYDLLTAENQLLMAKAQLSQAKAGELNARNNLSYTEVKSPSNGVIGMLPYRVGALVSPNIPQPLTIVSDNSEMFVYFSLTEKQLLNLTRQYGSKAEVLANLPELELQLSDDSIYCHKGHIESISGVIDRTTGTTGIRAVFPNPEDLLYSGTSGNVLMHFRHENVLTIPQTAVYEIQDQTFVYKIIDNKAVSAPVSVTRLNNGSGYIVDDGLVVGDKIIAKGVGLVHEGMQVVAANK